MKTKLKQQSYNEIVVKWQEKDTKNVTYNAPIIFTQEKFNNSGGWLGFDGLGV